MAGTAVGVATLVAGIAPAAVSVAVAPVAAVWADTPVPMNVAAPKRANPVIIVKIRVFMGSFVPKQPGERKA